jgi:glycosyltransferase involved in cell wall biosynthesis
MKINSYSKILIIAYYFPPMGTVGVLRNYHFAKIFNEIFKQVFVITTKNVSLKSQDNHDISAFKISQVFNFDYRNIFSGNNANTRKSINSKSKSKTIIFLRRLIDSFPLNTILGEGGIFYILSATYKAIKIVKKEKISHIYSSYRPIADHIIAFNLKIIFSKLMWIADFRDLPVDEFRQNTFFPQFQWKFVKFLLRKSDKVITVSEGLNKKLKDIYPASTVIPNGISRIYDFQNVSKFEKFTISYTGSLYPRFQKPKILLETISALKTEGILTSGNFSMIYAGKDSLVWQNEIAKFNLMDLNTDLGEIPMHESIKVQHKSHINTIFSWSAIGSQGIITGKFSEYLTTGNPIMMFINGEQDAEINHLFENLKIGKVFYNEDHVLIYKTIREYFDQWKKDKKLQFSPNTERLKKMEWDNAKKQLLESILV